MQVSIKPFIRFSHYTPTKAGVLSLMQSVAVALGKHGIRANAILPGTIQTDINKEDLSDMVKREAMAKRTSLGRLGGMHSPAELIQHDWPHTLIL